MTEGVWSLCSAANIKVRSVVQVMLFSFLNGQVGVSPSVILNAAAVGAPAPRALTSVHTSFPAVQNLGRPYWLTLSPMYLWMLVFFTRPHKEERFLFPIYPLVCLSGAVALSSLQVRPPEV